MSKVRNLPELISLSLDDIFYVVDSSTDPNGGRKMRADNLRTFMLDPILIKGAYESNPDTNAYTDAEKTKLAGIEPFATADQIAAEVPYDDTLTGLGASNVQTAIEKLDLIVDFGFSTKVVSGLIVSYTQGNVFFDGVPSTVLPGAILLATNVTDGYIYVDLDALVKQTASGVQAPPYTVPIAKFTTDATDVVSLVDVRTRINQNLVRGIVSDVRDIRAGAAASAGSSGRLSDAMHKHNILTGVVIGQTPDQVNAEGSDINLARADHTHNIPTGIASSLNATNSNAQGTASAFARQDHIHAISTGIVIGQTPDQSNAAGSSANLSRADHVHNIPTAAAVGLDATSTSTQGAAATFARSNHTHAIASGIVIGQAPDQSNAAGSSANFARADHVHNIPTAIAVDVSSANAQGAAATFARADHVHRGVRSLKAGLAGTQRFGDLSLVSGNGTTVSDDGSGNFTIDTTMGPNELVVTQGSGLTVNYTGGRVRINGTTTLLAASSFAVAANATNGRIYVDVDGIVKSTTATTTPPNAVPLAIFSSNVSSITALSENRTFLNVNLTFGSSGDIQALVPDGGAAAGSSNKYADAGHVHNVPTAAAVNLSASTTNTQGSSGSFARADHTHSISSGIVIGQTPDQSNAAGSSANFARADHVHNIPTGVPSSLNATNSNTQGTASAFARQDHLHAISTGVVIGQTPDQANAAGSSANLARADHVHNIPTAAAVSISTSTTNAQGAAATFANSAHTHAVSISNQQVTATSAAGLTTTAATDTLITGMTQAPAAGTYLVLWTSSCVNSANGTERTFVSAYYNGTQITNSEISIGTAGGAYAPVTVQGLFVANGTNTIEIRARVAGGTTTYRAMTMQLIKLA